MIGDFFHLAFFGKFLKYCLVTLAYLRQQLQIYSIYAVLYPVQVYP